MRRRYKHRFQQLVADGLVREKLSAESASELAGKNKDWVGKDILKRDPHEPKAAGAGRLARALNIDVDDFIAAVEEAFPPPPSKKERRVERVTQLSRTSSPDKVERAIRILEEPE